jgi:hypothetical protein
MHMRETRIEKEVDICVTNLANKTKCMSTNAEKWENNFWKHVISTTSAICGVKPEHSRLNSNGICHIIQIFTVR